MGKIEACINQIKIYVMRNVSQSYLGVVGAGQELIRKWAPVLPALMSKLVCAALSGSTSYC